MDGVLDMTIYIAKPGTEPDRCQFIDVAGIVGFFADKPVTAFKEGPNKTVGINPQYDFIVLTVANGSFHILITDDATYSQDKDIRLVRSVLTDLRKEHLRVVAPHLMRGK